MLDELRDLFLSAFYHQESEQILVKRWNEEISRLQDVFDRLTDKVSVSQLRPVVTCKQCSLWCKDESKLKATAPCSHWSNLEDAVYIYTNENDFCSYGISEVEE